MGSAVSFTVVHWLPLLPSPCPFLRSVPGWTLVKLVVYRFFLHLFCKRTFDNNCHRYLRARFFLVTHPVVSNYGKKQTKNWPHWWKMANPLALSYLCPPLVFWGNGHCPLMPNLWCRYHSSLSVTCIYYHHWQPNWSHVGAGQSPLISFTSAPSTQSFRVFYFSLFPFLTRFSIHSHSTRIVPLRFQTRCCMRRLNLALVFCVLLLCYMYFWLRCMLFSYLI